jgi:hypothetical protein
MGLLFCAFFLVGDGADEFPRIRRFRRV